MQAVAPAGPSLQPSLLRCASTQQGCQNSVEHGRLSFGSLLRHRRPGLLASLPGREPCRLPSHGHFDLVSLSRLTHLNVLKELQRSIPDEGANLEHVPPAADAGAAEIEAEETSIEAAGAEQRQESTSVPRGATNKALVTALQNLATATLDMVLAAFAGFICFCRDVKILGSLLSASFLHFDLYLPDFSLPDVRLLDVPFSFQLPKVPRWEGHCDSTRTLGRVWILTSAIFMAPRLQVLMAYQVLQALSQRLLGFHL